MDIEFITGHRGGQQVLLGGFRYVYERKNVESDTFYWKCCEYNANKCKARLNTCGSSFSLRGVEHNHPPSPAKCEGKKVLGVLKTKALNSSEVPKSVIATVTAAVSPSVAALLPSVDQMKRTIQRIREKENCPAPLPTSLEEMQIPDSLLKTLTGNKFLLYDSGPTNKRILMFSTHRNLEALGKSDQWFADGTFKVAPSLFYQVRNIFTSHMLSLVLSLLSLGRVATFTGQLSPGIMIPEKISRYPGITLPGYYGTRVLIVAESSR